MRVLPSDIRKLNGSCTKTYKRNLDKWLKTVPDETRIDNYAVCVAVERNSIVNEARRSVMATR